ncbi:hypothetical protein DV735_g5472, partial [Chaetothyriales sp. CBS 134920]
MNPSAGKPSAAARNNMPAFGTFGAQQPSAGLLFDKSNPGVRRTTPDSEAMASSDDEGDSSKNPAASNPKITKPTRRTSWLNDVSATSITRKPSVTAPYSPSASNPGTPAVDQPAWSGIANASGPAWNHPGPSISWGGIWGQDARKDHPSRLQEVIPQAPEGIPFSIPLQPTPKTYRSQSYSVGQLDTSSVTPSSGLISTADAPRSRAAAAYPSLQRRTSRQGGIGGLDSGLGKVREDDDEEEPEFPESTDHYDPAQVQRTQRLEQENAQLRYALHSRDRTLSSHSTNQPRNPRIPTGIPQEYDNAVDDQEDLSASSLLQRRGNNMRRMSEQAVLAYDKQQSPSAFDSSRKAHWQTSLGFGPIQEAPQSRRHSLAEVPTRHGSASSHGDLGVSTYASGPQDSMPGEDSGYFATSASTREAADTHVHSSYLTSQPYSPHSHLGTYLGPASAPLHIVNFKCCRSDVFYVQDNTGLQVGIGDLVIVEADRGTDLGTVQHINVTWDEARRYKEHYAEEHYKWLMMFSQQSRNGGPNVINPNGIPGRPGSGMGQAAGHHGAHDAGHSELKPKMIKRLAQAHEIKTLQDKEGNEAKAKRVCQQKVIEHRLNMEILDAEFQMDSKKLTFYYFADTYINFNPLVTDLFKIYKTRIWMSAINPASFQTPTASLGLQPAYGVLPNDRDSPAGRGRRPQYGQPQQSPMSFDGQYDSERSYQEQQQQHAGMRSPFIGQLGFPSGLTQFGPGMSPFTSMQEQHMDPMAQYYGQQPFHLLNPAAPNFDNGRPNLRSSGANQSPASDWTSRFQGLSLGSIFEKLTALREQTQKQDTWPREFDKVLDGKEQHALQKLGALRKKLSDNKARFESHLVGLFEAALCPIDEDEAESVVADKNDDAVQVPYMSVQKQAFAAKINRLLGDCHALTDTYHSLAAVSPAAVAGVDGSRASVAASLESDLDKDREAVRASIAAGRKLVQLEIDGFLLLSDMDPDHRRVRGSASGQSTVYNTPASSFHEIKAGTVLYQRLQNIYWNIPKEELFEENVPINDEQSFVEYMRSPAASAAAPLPEHDVDLDHPLSSYYISSSHNTYLSGNQLYGSASTDAYTNVLRSGCRCLEIDVWDGEESGTSSSSESDGEGVSRRRPRSDSKPSRWSRMKAKAANIRVLHGFTLTQAVTFRAVCQAIKESAFVASDLPVIVSLEVHANFEQQQKMVEIMKEAWKDHILNLSSLEQKKLDVLPPPSSLRNKILIKVKGTPASQSGESGAALEQVASTASQSNSGEATTQPKVSKIISALSELGVYTTAFTFKSWDQPEASLPNHVFSFSEGKMLEMHSDPSSGPVLFEHNKRFLTRVFPRGTRIRSTNVDPTFHWRMGAQMVALNWQRLDKGMMLNEGMFAGSQGWILKPEGYRPKDQVGSAADDKIAAKKRLVDLKIQLLCAQDLPLPQERDVSYKAKIKPYVQAQLHVDTYGPPGQGKYSRRSSREDSDPYGDEDGEDATYQRRSRTVRTDSPDFDDEVLYWSGVADTAPELSFVRLKIKDDRALAQDDLIAWACIRLDRLRPGLRLIRLLDAKRQPSAGLLLNASDGTIRLERVDLVSSRSLTAPTRLSTQLNVRAGWTTLGRLAFPSQNWNPCLMVSLGNVPADLC